MSGSATVPRGRVQMTTTEVLAVVGAVSGLAGTSIATLAFVRDRPRLIVSHVVVAMEKVPDRPDFVDQLLRDPNRVDIFVVNLGRRPVTITGAGLQQRGGHWLSSWSTAWAAEIGDSQLLAPGERRKYSLKDPRDRDSRLGELGPAPREKSPIRPYVIDARGKTVRGEKIGDPSFFGEIAFPR